MEGGAERDFYPASDPLAREMAGNECQVGTRRLGASRELGRVADLGIDVTDLMLISPYPPATATVAV